ncbi:MAG: hypothetical protein QXN63_00125 [Candidatus Bathyarchaeia archaeon]
MANLTLSHKSKMLTCPYDNCGKNFLKPLILTDNTKFPRESHYVCPHCFSKLEITLAKENTRLLTVKPCKDAATPATPAECPHFLGYLKTLPENTPIPDKCATCPKIVQCFIKDSEE